MLATLGGILALIVGLALLLLPVVVSELSRPRDSTWGAVVLLLGLVLVTSADRLTGAPMLAVLCGGLLIGRLGTEVAQARWRQLSGEEQTALGSSERWIASLNQLLTVIGQLLASVIESLARLQKAAQPVLQQRRQSKGSGKRWVRQESTPSSVDDQTDTPADEALAEAEAEAEAAETPAGETPAHVTADETIAPEADLAPEQGAEEARTAPETVAKAAPPQPSTSLGMAMAADPGAAPAAEENDETQVAAMEPVAIGSEPTEPAAERSTADETLLGPDAADNDTAADHAPSASPSPDARDEPPGDDDGAAGSLGEAEPDSWPPQDAAETEAEVETEPRSVPSKPEAEAPPSSATDPEPPPAADPLQVIQSFEDVDALLDLPSRRPAEPEPIVDVEVEDLAVEAMDSATMPPLDPDRR